VLSSAFSASPIPDRIRSYHCTTRSKSTMDAVM
jgi:hypothetical protein